MPRLAKIVNRLAETGKAERPVGIFVLGMHRSGTSVLTRILNLLGCSLPDDLLGANTSNPTGHWESAKAIAINDRLLMAMGRTWDDVRELPSDWLDRPETADAKLQIHALLDGEFSSKKLWVLKEPRLCRLAPIWFEVAKDLGIDTRVIIPVRHPGEVSYSLARRDGIGVGRGLLMWYQHLAEAEFASRGQARVLVHFHELLSNRQAQTDRIAASLGIRWPNSSKRAGEQIDEFIKPSLLHSDAKTDVPLPDPVAKLYRDLMRSDDADIWGVMARTTGAISHASTLFSPAIEDLALQAAKLSSTLAETKNWPLNGEQLQQLRHDNQGILNRLQETSPLLVELVRQVESQRASISEKTSSLSAENQEVLKKLDQNDSLVIELVRQVEAQRGSTDRSGEMLAELAGRVEAQRGSTDRSGEMLAELVRQVEQQRIELRAEHARHIEQQRHLSAQQMERLTMELGKQHALVAELTGSTSWKLTAPLRFMRRLLSWNTAATVARIPGRLARATYRAFLHAWPMRLRLKRGLASEQGREHPGPMETRVTAEQPADGQANGPAAADMSRNRNTYVAISPDPVSQEELQAKLIAFYLPQFHPIPENDEWWGRGFTEWTNVSKAEPQFEGHDQPHLPGELGFYDLRLPEVMHRQIELAQHYGVHGFCFHYYWFDGRRILERPLNQFLSDPSFDFPFCICWANENWTRRWDGQDHDILLGQHHSPESDVRFIQDAELILRDARYIRIDGRPLLIVYRPSILPDCAATLERWRQYCRDVGLGEIFIAMVQFDVEDPREFGFDAAVEFPPHKLARDLPQINEMLPGLKPDFQGYVVDYQAVASRAKAWPDEGFDLIRGVFPGWDNEARKPKQGYLFAHSSPEGYRDWLCNAIEYSRRRPVRGESIVFVNAWNEWAEGAYLEPDRRNGYAYLQATREALTCLPPGPSKIGDSDAAIATDAAKKDRIAVVSHDAHPHGAQYLALNLCRELSSHFQFDVHAVLLGEGVLEGEFAKVATVHRIDNSSGIARQNLAEHLARSGVRRAIANTTVSGLFAAELKRVGIRVVSLVHELPGVIESYGLHEHALAISNSADKVVFAAEAVREGFKVFAPLADSQSLVRAQGLYKRNRYRGAEAIGNARSLLRQRFGLANDTKIVLCVGYADLRKGVDLFVDIGERLVRRDKRIHMVWLGHPDLSLEQQIQAQVVATGFAEHFHFPGRDPDTDPYYAGCDLYALTSREDPFPSVIMEAFDVCVPVVGFASAGGFEALLRRGGGKLAPAFDLELFTEACRALLVADLERERLGAEGKAIVDREFSFREYIRDLLDLMGYPLPRVSVIVPNYNYAHFMGERLQSIADQSLPPYEIIVLDDASTDDSLARLEELSKSIDMRIIANEKNSGSVFQQWRKGIQEARGEFIWIAEADDLSDPDFLKKVLPAFEDERVVMSYCQSNQINGGGDVLCNDYLDYVSDFGRERWCMPFVADLNEELKRGLAIKNTIPNVSAVVFRRSNLAAVMDQHIEDISSYRIAGDWVAYLHLLESGNLAFWPEPLNRHRRHGGSVTIGSSQKAHLDEVLQVQRYVAGKYQQDEATQLAARNYELFLREYFGLGEGIAK